MLNPLGPKYPLLGTTCPKLRVQGRSWFRVQLDVAAGFSGAVEGAMLRLLKTGDLTYKGSQGKTPPMWLFPQTGTSR